MKIQEIRQTAAISLRRAMNRAGVRNRKIFAVGFNKCGTTSLHALFTSRGLASNHGVEWRSCDDMKLLQSYDCFSDGIPEDLSKLDVTFPGSKFILQVRDLESWIYSRLAHIEREKKGKSNYGSPEWDVSEYAVKTWIKQRNAHHLFVLRHFSQRPDDLLVVNFIRDGLAATKVCNFLGYKGDHDRPKENVNPKKKPPLDHAQLVAKCVGELGIPDHELQFDIYCPCLEDEQTQAVFPADTSMLL